MSGNILWTYVLPALPAMALLAARWLSLDLRKQRINAVVGAGVLVMALLVAAFFLREHLLDSWKSAKTVVRAQQASAADQQLFFMGDLPYSASFYSQGKAQAVADNTALLKLMERGSVLVALNADQVKALPADVRLRLTLRASSGAYQLFLSVSR